MDITYSVLPKFFQHYDVPRLASMVREVNLDTINLMVRDGYWVNEHNIGTELPAFVKAMRSEAIDVSFATTTYSADQLVADPSPLGIMADNGIAQFRLSHLWVSDGDARASLEAAKASLGSLERLCEKHAIQAVYQVHHGTLIASAFAAWALVKNLHPRYIGVELDPGNQAHEGYESWDKSVSLLGDHMVAMGVKDVAWLRQPVSGDEHSKGWHTEWVPLADGITDWYELMRALHARDWSGLFAFMPFYHENEPEKLTRLLKEDVRYLRQVQADIESE